MSIYIKFEYNTGASKDTDTILYGIDPKITTVRELIEKFLVKSNSITNIDVEDTDKIIFMFNGKIINTPKFLNKYLCDKQINLVESDKSLLVTKGEDIIGQSINKPKINYIYISNNFYYY